MRKKGFAGVSAVRAERATQLNSVWPPARPFFEYFHTFIGGQAVGHTRTVMPHWRVGDVVTKRASAFPQWRWLIGSGAQDKLPSHSLIFIFFYLSCHTQPPSMRKKGFAGVAAGRTDRATQPNSVWPPARPFFNFIHTFMGVQAVGHTRTVMHNNKNEHTDNKRNNWTVSDF